MTLWWRYQYVSHLYREKNNKKLDNMQYFPTAGKEQSWDLNPHSLVPEFISLNQNILHLSSF